MRQVKTSAPWCSTTRAAHDSFFEALVQDNIGIGRPEEVSMGVRPPVAPSDTASLPDPDLHHRHRDPNRLPLQALPHQAVLAGRPRAADRDGGQPSHRPRSQRPPRESPRTGRARPGPATKSSGSSWSNGPARAVPSGPRPSSGSTALGREGQRTGALRFGDSRHGPGRYALCRRLVVTGFTNKSLRALSPAPRRPLQHTHK